MNRIILSIAFILIFISVNAQNYDIRFNRTSVNCQTRQVCYDVQLRPNGATVFNLAGQNYRIFWDATKATFLSATSTLPSQYSPYTQVQLIENVNAGATNGPLLFEDNLSFLNYTMVLNDDLNGGIVLPAGQWTTTSNICVTVSQDVINSPTSCVEFVWGRAALTSQYATAYVEVSRWVSANNTTASTGILFDDMNSDDGDAACFDVACAVSSISVNDITVNEGAGTAAVQVCIPSAAAQNVTAVLNTSNGTATSGSDYTAVSNQTVTIAAGQTCTTVNVPIIDDNTAEGQEQFNVTLTSASSNATLGDPNGLVTITDNDGVPSLAINSISVNENAGTAMLTVTMSNASTSPVTVTVNTSNGTAIAGSDYTSLTSYTLTIPAGSTTGTVTVSITDDAVAESNETFNVALSSPVNATIATATGVVTILDNEVACNAQAPILSGN